ncbi:hypothetical protein [Streptomyces sp. NPDC093105]|uniref:hypothetical protein n=1 Tax=Streptomyces sp. NPDC093105 TaxID=3366029 RepID=UPI00380798A7
MSTAPPPPNNTPHPFTGSPAGPPPPQPPPPPRRGWYGSLSEGGKVTVIGAVIVGVSTLAAAILPSVLSSGDGKGGGDAKPPASQITTQDPTQEPTKTQEPTPTAESDPTGETPSGTPTATETATGGTDASAPPASRTYEVFYQDQAMSLGLPPGEDVGSIDFDVPATRRYSEEEWTTEKEKAEQSGVPVTADLTYADTSYGYLALRNGRNAAQLQPTDPSEKAADCARAAQVGGFTEAVMDDWTLPAQTVLCILTDQGNVARVTITGFIGGKKDGLTDPPTQISLKVTLWKPKG